MHLRFRSKSIHPHIFLFYLYVYSVNEWLCVLYAVWQPLSEKVDLAPAMYTNPLTHKATKQQLPAPSLELRLH